MQVKNTFCGPCALYLSSGTCYEVNIRQLCSGCVINLYDETIKTVKEEKLSDPVLYLFILLYHINEKQ